MLKPSFSRSSAPAIALVVAATLLLSACTSSDSPDQVVVTKSNGQTVTVTQTAPPESSPSTSSKPEKPANPVHIKTLNADGVQYGVGMPVIAFFSKKIKSGKALQDATKVTADGEELPGAWYFEYSSYYPGYPIEAHWRPQHYWPAHSQVHVDIPTKGLSAGGNLEYDDSLTLDFSIGAKNIALVNNATHRITVTSDGKKKFDMPVSLGAPQTPTVRGIKVIMEKGRDISMRGPGYFDPHVKFTQRLTYDGEYLHAAPWNTYNIDHGINSSNGCTNLHPDDAEKLYGFLEVGDVVVYPNATGPAMQLGEGYGDWNLAWDTWLTGGLVSTTS